MQTRFLSPPLTPLFRGSPILECMHFSSPSFWMAYVHLIFFCFDVTHLGSLRKAWNRMYSCTVKYPRSTSCCWMYAVSVFSLRLEIFFPSNRISPLMSPTVFLRLMTSRSVVFPAPEGPSRAYISPPLIVPATFLSTLFVNVSRLGTQILDTFIRKSSTLLATLALNLPEPWACFFGTSTTYVTLSRVMVIPCPGSKFFPSTLARPKMRSPSPAAPPRGGGEPPDPLTLPPPLSAAATIMMCGCGRTSSPDTVTRGEARSPRSNLPAFPFRRSLVRVVRSLFPRNDRQPPTQTQ
mmetsp:Transcript_4560/g.13560  ORF Transcript_4560/g.13560 Transcript_4560/m.13560 type:complete len:294 (-) Transcript_4560:24-905(-)